MDKILEENKLLKTQIAQLKAVIELNSEKNIQQHSNVQINEEIQTQNRFESLVDIETEDEIMDSNQDFVHNLKLKNEKKRKINDSKSTEPSKNKLPKNISNDKKRENININEPSTSSSNLRLADKKVKPPS